MSRRLGIMTDYISVQTTTDSEENAQKISRALLDAHLAACVQISAPIESSYRWKGKLETAREWRLTIKSRRPLFTKLEEAIRAVHPYSTPQILALPIVEGNRDYLSWIDEVTS